MGLGVAAGQYSQTLKVRAKEPLGYFRQMIGIARCVEHASSGSGYSLGDTALVDGEHRIAAGERFDRGKPERLRRAGRYRQIHRGIQISQLIAISLERQQMARSPPGASSNVNRAARRLLSPPGAGAPLYRGTLPAADQVLLPAIVRRTWRGGRWETKASPGLRACSAGKD